MKKIQMYLTMLIMTCSLVSLSACGKSVVQEEQQTTVAVSETKTQNNNSKSNEVQTEKMTEKASEVDSHLEVEAKSEKEVNVESADTESVVDNQESLESALLAGNYSKITIETADSVNFEIPEGDYSNIDLVVNTPNADISNSGKFNSITINAIATDTWTENVNGNVLVINAAAGHIVIPEDAELQEIQIKNANSYFVLDVKGKVGTINVDAETQLNINVTGVVDTVNVNDIAVVNIAGKSSQNINVNVEANADGTAITSNVAVNVKASANTEVNIQKGAEGSSVIITDNSKEVEVTNNSKNSIKVTTEDNVISIETGKNGTIDGSGNVTDSTTNGIGTKKDDSEDNSSDDSDNGGGGSNTPNDTPAKPSGNITRRITRFETIPSVCAGTIGDTLISEDKIVFPKQVVGYASNGDKVTFPVVRWTNDNNYNPSVGVGNYYYTAVLGNPVTISSISSNYKYTIKDGVTARLRVYVKGLSDVEYLNDGAVNIDVKIYETQTADVSCMVLTNNNSYPAHITGKIEYYDANGYLNAAVTKNISSYIHNGSEGSFSLMPGESYIEAIDESGITYNKRVISIEADARENDTRKQVLDKISITYKETEEALEVTVTNTSGKQIGGVSIDALFFDENGKVITGGRTYTDGYVSGTTSKVYGAGYTDIIKLGYVKESKYDYETGTTKYTYYKPASYKVFVHGAIESEQTGTIPENNIPKNIDVKFYETQTAGVSCMVLTNNNSYPAHITGKIEYYDANGYLNAAVTKNISSYIHNGSEGSFSLMPGESYIEAIDESGITYNKRVISIEADARENDTRKQVLDKISITYKETEEALEVTVTNTSGKQIGGVSIDALFFDENGKVITGGRTYTDGYVSGTTSKVYGAGYTDAIKLGYVKELKYDPETGTTKYTYYKPTSYLVYLHGAIVSDNN